MVRHERGLEGSEPQPFFREIDPSVCTPHELGLMYPAIIAVMYDLDMQQLDSFRGLVVSTRALVRRNQLARLQASDEIKPSHMQIPFFCVIAKNRDYTEKEIGQILESGALFLTNEDWERNLQERNDSS